MATVSKGIVITTSEHTKDFLIECLNSLKNAPYSVLVVCNNTDTAPAKKWLKKHRHRFEDEVVFNNWNAFELGGIYRGKQNFDEFVHLMDTTIVKDISVFDEVFKLDGHVFFTNGGYHYMGKFVSSELPEIPRVDNKNDAIALELRWLNGKMRTYFTPDLPVHTNVFEEIHGKTRMRLENDYLIKFKGTYHL